MGKRAPVIGLGALICFCLSAAALAAEDPSADLGRHFAPYEACALIDTRDRYREQQLEVRPSQCRMPLSPCSTFKIANALIGLVTGAVSGPNDVKRWDGIVREREETNRDHSLASAMEQSVVWYFQDIARYVGVERMQSWLDRLEYGNRDISSGIDRFWLSGSLRVDAYQQLDLVKKLWRGALPFPSGQQAEVRTMMLQRSDLPGELHGKTGSCRGDETKGVPDHGWFVGWVEWEAAPGHKPATSWFVVNIIGDGASGSQARAMALELLVDTRP